MSNELDLQEQTRMWDTYDQMQTMVGMLKASSVFPSLVWLWSWDAVQEYWHGFMDGSEEGYAVTMELHEVWEQFWKDADKNGFSLEYGTEDLHEAIRDWMFDAGIVEEALDEEEDDVIESGEEEV